MLLPDLGQVFLVRKPCENAVRLPTGQPLGRLKSHSLCFLLLIKSATAARGMARSVERRRRTVRLRHSGEDHSWSADGNVDGWACDSRADAFVRETLGLTPFRTQRAPELLKLFEQRLGLFQIERVEAFAEPTVNRSE